MNGNGVKDEVMVSDTSSFTTGMNLWFGMTTCDGTAVGVNITNGTVAVCRQAVATRWSLRGGFAASMAFASRAPAIPSLPGHDPVPPDLDGPVTLDIIPGPRADWTAGLDDLAATSWMASPACDRVGVRLEGRPLRRAERYAEKELPSEGVMRGAVQVPPSGLPVLFLNDHPVTGGYPVIGVLTEASSDRLGQVRPGQEVWFHVSTGGTGRTGRDA